MKSFFFILLSFTLCFCVSSCSGKDEVASEQFTIVGTWEGDFDHGIETYTFKSDGTYYDITSRGRRYDGVYTLSKETLTIREESHDGYSTFTIKVEVVSPTKMIWSNFSDAPNEKVILNKL